MSAIRGRFTFGTALFGKNDGTFIVVSHHIFFGRGRFWKNNRDFRFRIRTSSISTKVNDFLFKMSLHMHVLFDRFATWDHLDKMLQTLLVLMNFAGRGGKLGIENVTR